MTNHTGLVLAGHQMLHHKLPQIDLIALWDKSSHEAA